MSLIQVKAKVVAANRLFDPADPGVEIKLQRRHLTR
jgi:hypothetical protein